MGPIFGEEHNYNRVISVDFNLRLYEVCLGLKLRMRLRANS